MCQKKFRNWSKVRSEVVRKLECIIDRTTADRRELHCSWSLKNCLKIFNWIIITGIDHLTALQQYQSDIKRNDLAFICKKNEYFMVCSTFALIPSNSLNNLRKFWKKEIFQNVFHRISEFIVHPYVLSVMSGNG